MEREVEALKHARNNATAQKKEAAMEARIRKEEEALALKAQIAKLKADEAQEKWLQLREGKNKLQRKKTQQNRRHYLQK